MNRDREAIARIVDPSLWETADRLLALTPDRDLSGTLAASLAKADAILALFALSAAPKVTTQAIATVGTSVEHTVWDEAHQKWMPLPAAPKEGE